MKIVDFVTDTDEMAQELHGAGARAPPLTASLQLKLAMLGLR
jgi:hypothetical protein